MSDQYVISAANLSYIERNLKAINGSINSLEHDVDQVNENVRVVYRELASLATEFHTFVDNQNRVNIKSESQRELIRIRQEMEKRFGKYEDVRSHTTGILQANDLGIVKKETISNVTEELMLATPGYWLAPCLVALAAWINDMPELAERALREGIKRNDEKTSLFFALVCRRADRKQASLKWTQRYLANQDEEQLDRKTVIILDAFASGLLGADTEGVISKQMTVWLEKLADKPGFIEQQVDQWSDAINLRRQPLPANEYTYLRKYSKTWPVLSDIMEGAYLHAEMLSYFIDIFEQQDSTDTLKEQLDEILTSLVTDFDDEELPLRKEEKYHQFVVDFNGDDERAKKNMQLEESAFEVHKDFTQLLTDAAMKPESSHASVSTQKFAIALSKDWISTAYDDIVARNRMKIPNEISINVDTFNDITRDGRNEQELLGRFHAQMNREKEDALSKCTLTAFENFSLIGGIIIAVIGLGACIFNQLVIGLIAIVAGIGLVISYFSKKKKIDAGRQNIEDQYEQKIKNGSQIILATLAEIVDFRAEFSEKDAQSGSVKDFLEQISPEQYVRKLADSNRRINVNR